MQHIPITGGALVVLGVITLLYFLRGSTESEQSQQAHVAAQKRNQPVEIGGTYELGVTEFTEHHSGSRVGVGKVEGFVLFIEDLPSSVAVGDVVEAKVMSYNRGGTSADAKYIRKK